jgi:hypothetical protein
MIKTPNHHYTHLYGVPSFDPMPLHYTENVGTEFGADVPLHAPCQLFYPCVSRFACYYPTTSVPKITYFGLFIAPFQLPLQKDTPLTLPLPNSGLFSHPCNFPANVTTTPLPMSLPNLYPIKFPIQFIRLPIQSPCQSHHPFYPPPHSRPISHPVIHHPHPIYSASHPITLPITPPFLSSSSLPSNLPSSHSPRPRPILIHHAPVQFPLQSF